jgi:endo-1,4-beta-D-glucanase Y
MPRAWKSLRAGAPLVAILAAACTERAIPSAPADPTDALVLSGAPAPPGAGAYETGVYRNLIREWNPSITEGQIRDRLDGYWASLFGTDASGGYTPDAERRVYFPAGTNANGRLAYIQDIGSNDVRSEGMSYGMMIAVQMNRKAEFDALWNWSKTHMQYREGPRAGYFQWTCQTTGCHGNEVPAPDGEEYFAMALFFAGHRWGNGRGIYNYVAEANQILNVMLHKETMNGGRVGGITNMFDHAEKQVVFVPYYDSAKHTDPSYHLPAFYELWGRWATGYEGRMAADRKFWRDAAKRSRELFVQAAHPVTGLTPDYSEFDGRPKATPGGHQHFKSDAWRTAVNWAIDYSWWAKDRRQVELTDRLLGFFHDQGQESWGGLRYRAHYTLDGTPLVTYRSGGLIASNGAAALAATDPRAWKFVEELWSLQPPTGQWRYYDGMLQFMALLHASGNFRIYRPANRGVGFGPPSDVPEEPGTPEEPTDPTAPLTLTLVSGPVENAVNPTNTTFTYSVTGGTYGLRDPYPLDVKIELIAPGVTGADACIAGWTGAACGFQQSNLTFSLPTPLREGYYRITVRGVDGEWNASAPVQRLLLRDVSGPMVDPGYGTPPAPPAAGEWYSYTVGTLSDNLDLAWTAPRIQIRPGSGSYPIGPNAILGSYGPDVLTRTAGPVTYGGTWIRGWQETGNDAAPTSVVTKPNAANYLTQDVAGNRAEAWRNFAAGLPEPEFASFTDRGVSTFRSSVSRSSFTSHAETFTVTARVVSAGSAAPFSRIWVYQGPSGGGWGSFWLTEVGTAPTRTDNGDGTSTWTWTSAPIAASEIDAWKITRGNVQMRLAGVSADGYALLSTWSTITMP